MARMRRGVTPRPVEILAVVVAVAVVVAIGAGWRNFDQQVTATAADAKSQPAVISTKAPDAADDTRLGGGATIASVHKMVTSNKPMVISVLGDSTGNATDEWVYLWSEHLAQTRAVTYHAWDDVRLRWTDPQTLSTTGPKTEVWNMSAPGKTAAYPAPTIKAMQPVRPDLVLYNFGHNNTADNLDTELYATLTAVEDLWGTPVPSLAILQNPERGDTAEKHAATVRELRETIGPAFGLDTVDVWTAFKKADAPLTELISNADGLGIHPSAAGSQVWADAVAAELG